MFGVDRRASVAAVRSFFAHHAHLSNTIAAAPVARSLLRLLPCDGVLCGVEVCVMQFAVWLFSAWLGLATNKWPERPEKSNWRGWLKRPWGQWYRQSTPTPGSDAPHLRGWPAHKTRLQYAANLSSKRGIPQQSNWGNHTGSCATLHPGMHIYSRRALRHLPAHRLNGIS